MRLNHIVKASIIAAVAYLAVGAESYADPLATEAQSSPQAAPPVQVPVALVQVANASVTANVSEAADGLHEDARWPKFAMCVNNTATPDAFTDCLRTAFMTDGTGSEMSLLRH